MSSGLLIVDDYTLLSCIATGSHCQIWEVRAAGHAEHLALKLMSGESLRDSDQLKALKNEAKVASSLSHPGLIRFHRVVTTKQHAYIVLEYFRSPNLKQILKADPGQIHRTFGVIVEGVCHALGHMHEKGWIHKDIKPENILASRSGETRLIDFSLAVRTGGTLGKLLGGSKSIQGTRTYIAPETLRRQPALPQTDIYSLGVTFFELVTGNPPFRGSSPNDLLAKHLSAPPPPPSQSNPNVTPELDRLILRMLEKEPAKRHRDLADVFSEFKSIRPFHQEFDPASEAVNVSEPDAASGLDSRADAERTARGESRPVPAQPRTPPPVKLPPSKSAPRAPVATKPEGPVAPAMPAGVPVAAAPKPSAPPVRRRDRSATPTAGTPIVTNPVAAPPAPLPIPPAATPAPIAPQSPFVPQSPIPPPVTVPGPAPAAPATPAYPPGTIPGYAPAAGYPYPYPYPYMFPYGMPLPSVVPGAAGFAPLPTTPAAPLPVPTGGPFAPATPSAPAPTVAADSTNSQVAVSRPAPNPNTADLPVMEELPAFSALPFVRNESETRETGQGSRTASPFPTRSPHRPRGTPHPSSVGQGADLPLMEELPPLSGAAAPPAGSTPSAPAVPSRESRPPVRPASARPAERPAPPPGSEDLPVMDELPEIL